MRSLAARYLIPLAPWTILGVAAVLRLWGLGYSFSNDELSALLRLQTTSFVTLIQQGVVPDFHPAGVQVFLWIWVRLGGMSEEWVR
ncbi:MAG TPA: hypothetical protein P5248_05210, partial [Bacteroidales bacterium]|nr:hypothetical protein [Bacteroidales bacterium]